MRFVVAVLALSLAIPAASRAQAPEGAPSAGPPTYDAASLLASLRPEERARAVTDAQLRDANELSLYELGVEVADDLRSFTLDETARLTNRTSAPWTVVVFRVHANAVGPSGERPLVELVSGACLDGARCTVEASSPSTIVVRPGRALAPGARLRVRMRLRGRLREIDPSRTTMMGQGMESLGALGLDGSSAGTAAGRDGDYGLLAHSDRVASFGAFFPVLARMRGGMWEERDASTMGDLGSDELCHVRARVRVRDGVRVVAAGVEGSPRVVGARTEHLVEAAFIRDFAFVASPRLAHVDRTVGQVDVRSWTVEGDEASGREVLDVAATALEIFTRRFGPYPYTQLDVVEAPLVGGAGGVELSGMVTVSTMFYRPMSASGASSAGGDAGLLGQLLAAVGGAGGQGVDLEARRHAMIEVVTAHEVAHQWWHVLVGSDSREHPWQDECLAQFSALLYLRERHGAARADEEDRQQVVSSYHMMRMMGRADGAVDRPVSAFGDPLSYAGLVYGKGPHVYVALRRLLGDARFFGALRQYVDANRFRIAAPRALFDRMARGPRAARVRALERRWLDEEHGDADLGQPDLGRMLGLGSAADDPATRAVLDQLGRMGQTNGRGGAPNAGSEAALRDMLRGLLGGGPPGGSPPGGSPPGGGSASGGDESSQEMLREAIDLLQNGAP
jgi:hypothetical protein